MHHWGFKCFRSTLEDFEKQSAITKIDKFAGNENSTFRCACFFAVHFAVKQSVVFVFATISVVLSYSYAHNHQVYIAFIRLVKSEM